MMTPEGFTAKRFDYLIIGGGLSGLCIAARLTEDPSVTVGVLEAGADHLENPLVCVPGFLAQLYENMEYDWCFKTVPQKYANNRIISWPRGKMLGGSSATNFMGYARPSRRDLDNWARLGNEGWDWDELFPYFQKSEYLVPPAPGPTDSTHRFLRYEPKYHGTTGPIKTGFINDIASMKAWIPTMESLGLKAIPSSYGGEVGGAWNCTSTIDIETGTRSHSGSAYYAPNAKRPNLIVLTNAHASKIVMELSASSNNLVASGVKFLVGDATFVAKLKNTQSEVILCAGSVQSPQLLELSGIGDRDLLSSKGIDVLYENPSVGENLQDHTLTNAVYELIDGERSIDSFQDPKVLEKALREYQDKKSGLLVSGPSSMAFLPCSELITEIELAEVMPVTGDSEKTGHTSKTTPGLNEQCALATELLASPDDSSVHFIIFGGHSNLSLSDGHIVKQLFTPLVGKTCFSLMISLTRPFSRGSIHISSKNPKHPLEIDPHYLEKPVDKRILAGAVRYMARLVDTPPLGSLIKERIRPPPETNTLAQYEEYVSTHVSTTYHPVGTCSMLPEQKGGVVNNRLVVYGTDNLRVADASIIPLQVSGNIQSTVYALAEKAADIIKEDRRRRKWSN